MSKEGNNKRDDQISALHAALLAMQTPVGAERPGTTWVFASQTAAGIWLFTYKTQDESPGEGWRKIARERIANVDGGQGFIRVEP